MDTPTGTLEKFHLGISADGRSCLLVFIDGDGRAMKCLADVAELNALISNLSKVAGEMTRRRTMLGDGDDRESPPHARMNGGTLNVASGAFQMSAGDDYIEGALVGDTGEIVGIRMCPEVAFQLTRAMLATAPAASAC